MNSVRRDVSKGDVMRKKPTRGSVSKRNFRAGFPDSKFGLYFQRIRVCFSAVVAERASR
jgi:hypothetical protein